MAANGMALTCAGMMDGQLIVCTDPEGDSSTIMFVVMASNPESSVEIVYSIFQNLISEKFSNCILCATNQSSYLTLIYLLNSQRKHYAKNV